MADHDTPQVPMGPVFCTSCGRRPDTFGPGPNGRPNSMCQACGALERHRFLAILLAAYAPEVTQGGMALEVAPTRSITRILRRSVGDDYIGIDLDPNADGRRVQVVADLCHAPFASGSMGTIVSFHVFEHIPDDRAAMREFSRILSVDGLGFIQVPWRPRTVTDEDPDADPDERIRRFGQADHVRYYGGDFEDRLLGAGVIAMRLAPGDLVPVEALPVLRLSEDPIWVAVGASSPLTDLGADTFADDARDRVQRVLNRKKWPGAEPPAPPAKRALRSRIRRKLRSLLD